MKRRALSWIGLHGTVVLAAVAVGFPFFYMLTTSFKTIGEV